MTISTATADELRAQTEPLTQDEEDALAEYDALAAYESANDTIGEAGGWR